MSERAEIVVVGAGIAGLACARELARVGADVLVVGEHLGGRIRVSRAGANLGASYVTSDYKETDRFLARGARIWMREVAFLDRDHQWHTVFHPRNVRRIGQLARLCADVLECRRLLARLRSEVKDGADPRDAMKGSPRLRALVEMPARELVRSRRYEDVAEIYAEPILHSTLFVPLGQANAFYFLASLFPVVLPVWAGDFTRTVARLSESIGRMVSWRVSRIDSIEGAYRLECDYGTIVADTVVLATPPGSVPVLPPAVVEDVEPPARRVPVTSLHVQGRRRPTLPREKTLFFRPGSVVTVLWRQADGTDVAFSHEEAPDLSALYEEVEVLDSIRWTPAIVVSGREWRPRQLAPRFFVIGDYNVCGLEDSFLSGSGMGRVLAKSRC